MDQKFLAFKTACERTNQPRLVQTTLAVIEKLISSDLLVGEEYWTESIVAESQPADPETPDSSKVVTKSVMDIIVETIFQCVQKASPDDEELHLLAIRCILSCFLSPHRLVHGHSLMACVRTCYLINKNSKSASAQSTATAALTQMLKTLTSRLEKTVADIEEDRVRENPIPAIGDWASSYARNLLNKTVLLSDPDNEAGDDRGRIGWCIRCGDPADYYCRKAREPVCSMSCKKIHLNRLQVATGEISKPTRSRKIFKSIEYRDIMSVFRSLCRLSSSTASSGTDYSPSIIKSTRLSLELISSILESMSSNLTLSRDPGFLEAVRISLFDCLLTNSVSPIVGIFDVALGIFSTYLLSPQFKEHVLQEIGLFVYQVLIYILESPNSPEAHKLKAIEIFSSMDCELVLKLFQQFDCSIDQKNVIELSVNALVGAVKSSGSVPAMKALCRFVESLSDFAQKTRLPPSVQDESAIPTLVSPSGLASAGELASVVAAHSTAVIPSQGKQRKLLLQEGLDLFKVKPNKGIDFLLIHGFIDSSEPAVLARALIELPHLDKRGIGEFIGDNKPENLGVLYALTDLMEFKNMELDQALRNFLGHFRLPGEAQKIDRIMEKFAEKFASDNPSRYANADSAYVLSFAVIMLNTDLHSAQIKKKMTIEEFVRLGKGINTEIEIAQSELERLYRNIESSEISLSEEDEIKKHQELASSLAMQAGDDVLTVQRKRLELFLKETEQMVQKSKVTLSEQRREKQLAVDASKIVISDNDVRDILIITENVLLEGLLAAATTLPLVPEDIQTRLISTIAVVVKLAILLDLESIRSKFLSALVQVAIVDPSKQPVEFRSTEATIAVLDIAGNHGNGLGGHSDWIHIVRLISFIDRMSLISSHKPDGEGNSSGGGPGPFSRFLFGSAYAIPPSTTPSRVVFSDLEKLNAEIVVSTIDPGQVDLIFTRSVSLSPVNLLGLTSALVEVSSGELSEHPPRMFSCQRIVELADFNMTRQIRIVWSKIWNIIAPFFVKIATQGSIFAIDSLRQLAFKFLSKPELGNYHFQTEFMRPFSLIMASADQGCQDMVLSVMDSLVKQVATNLKSGWISVFSVIAIACKSQSSESLVDSAASLLSEINTNAFSAALSRGEHFREFMNCLILLLQNQKSKVDKGFSFSAIRSHIERLSGRCIEDSNELTNHWLCVARGLSTLMADKRQAVRAEAMTILFDEILNNQISTMEIDTVQIILRAVLIPWLDDLMHGLGDTVSIEQGIAIVSETTMLLNRTIETNFEGIFSKFIFELLNFNSLLILCNKSDKICQAGLGNVRIIAEKTKDTLLVVDALIRLIAGTVPRILLENTNVTTITSLPFNPDQVLCTCSTHLHLIQLVGEQVSGTKELRSESSFRSLRRVLEVLQQTKEFAVRFNSEIALREKLKSLGFMRDLRQLPGLLKQERAALSVTLQILFFIEHNVQEVIGDVAQCREELRQTCNEIVDSYSAKETRLGTLAVQIRDSLIDEIEREINGLVPIISNVIVSSGFGGMSESEFSENRLWIFDLLIKLVLVNNLSIRQAAAGILASKFRS